MELGQLLTPSDLTHPEVSPMVFRDFFCLLVYRFVLSCVICYEGFCLHVLNKFFCSAVFCPRLGLYLVITSPTPESSSLSRGIPYSHRGSKETGSQQRNCFVRKREMPSQNTPILELKLENLPLDLPCSVLVTNSRETPTTGKYYKKKPDRLFPKDEREINNFCKTVSQFIIIYKIHYFSKLTGICLMPFS